MSEDDRLKLLETVLEAHASLADAALELRRRFSRQSPLAKAAVKAVAGGLPAQARTAAV